jgi:hypothetical protein
VEVSSIPPQALAASIAIEREQRFTQALRKYIDPERGRSDLPDHEQRLSSPGSQDNFAKQEHGL